MDKTIDDFGFDANLNREIKTQGTPTVFNQIDEGINAGQINVSNLLGLLTLGFGSFTIQDLGVTTWANQSTNKTFSWQTSYDLVVALITITSNHGATSSLRMQINMDGGANYANNFISATAVGGAGGNTSFELCDFVAPGGIGAFVISGKKNDDGDKGMAAIYNALGNFDRPHLQNGYHLNNFVDLTSITLIPGDVITGKLRVFGIKIN